MARYSVGIDLGTTHCVLAYLDLSLPEHERSVQVLNIPQLVAPGNLAAPPLLPSFIYLPHSQEFNAGDLKLPWSEDTSRILGELARQVGSKSPGRLVSSAKSWLSHRLQDAREAFLPLEAPEDVTPISPGDATLAYLEYLRDVWNQHFPEDPLEDQLVTVTVPASFDPAARDLTVEAAQAAGLQELTLLEEPQAAFYSWLGSQGPGWRERLQVGDLLLVADLGGGTCDFSLITVTEQDGELSLERVAVGDHILLGGDNMDLALAYGVRAKLAQEGRNLDQWQVMALAHGCREAKERMLADDSLDEYPLVVPGRGSSLIGSSIRTALTRDELQNILLEGFFPIVPSDARPQQRLRTALTTRSLPYAQDAAVTRHLAAFLARQLDESSKPNRLLLNGGVFKADVLAGRLQDCLNDWLREAGSAPIQRLEGTDLDLAVARGAAIYGAARAEGGVRVKAGLAASYYVGVESSMPAVPGFEPPLLALCVAPFGMEEGESAQVARQSFGVVIGEPARFRFFSSTTRKDSVGALLEHWQDELQELEPIEVTFGADAAESGRIEEVVLESRVTETGTLRLAARSLRDGRQWDVEFSVRQR